MLNNAIDYRYAQPDLIFEPELQEVEQRRNHPSIITLRSQVRIYATLETGYAYLPFFTPPVPSHSHKFDLIRGDVHCYTEDVDLFEAKQLKLS